MRWPHLSSDRAAVVVLQLSLSLLAVWPAIGQIPRERALVRDSLDVRLINLDAVVTDRSNNPILDLEASDFDLRVDGKKVEVTSVSRGLELRETVAGRLTIVVLVDDRHLQKKHRDAVLREIADTLEVEMKSNPTWVAVTTLSDQLTAVLPPSRDVGAVLESLARTLSAPVEPSRLRAMQRSSMNEVQEMLRMLTQAGSAYRVGQHLQTGVSATLRSYGEALALDTRQTLSSLEGLVEALSFVPGRKAVLLVSDGLPRSPLDLVAKTMYDRLAGGSRHYGGDDIVSGQVSLNLNDPNTRPTGHDRADRSGVVTPVTQHDDGGALDFQRTVGELDCGAAFERLSALANTHRVSFYPLKPPVLDPSVSSLGERTRERGSITQLSDMRSGLESLAGTTGGLFFSAERGVAEFLRQTRIDFSAYYSLGFAPPESMRDSAIREFVLKVNRRRSNLRYRASYMPLSLEQRLASRAWGTLLFRWEENEHGLVVETSPAGLQGGAYELDILLSLPIGELELVPSGRMASGTFRAVLQLRRSDGARLDPEHLTFAVEIPAGELDSVRGQFFAVRSSLRLRPGRYDMAIGLWEENSGNSTFIIHRLAVGVEEPEVA